MAVQSQGSHIVGGDVFFEYLRGNTFTIGLKLYYDQLNADRDLIDDEVELGIFSKRTNGLRKTVKIPLTSVNTVNYSNPFCVPDSIKTLEILYTTETSFLVSEFQDREGFYISWERCCRNGVVTNIFNPGGTGMVFYLEFPSLAEYSFNSVPKFEKVKGDYICKDRLFELDFSANDRDGDSLVYDLVVPLAGHTSPQYPFSSFQAAPYPLVQGYFNMPGNPPLSIDAQTGIVSVRPTLEGLFVLTVRCQEFRDGVKLGEARRDFQIPVVNCPPNPSPGFQVYESGILKDPGDTLIARGRDSLCFDIRAWDPSSSDLISFQLDPINFEGFEDQVFFPDQSPTNGILDTVDIQFCWPNCYLEDSIEVFEFDILAKDLACPIPNETRQRFYLRSIPEENSAPRINTEFPEYQATVESELIVRVIAIDADPEDVLTMEFLSGLDPDFDIPFEFVYEEGSGFAEGELRLYPSCQNLDPSEIDLVFSVTDNSCRENKSDTTSALMVITDYEAGESDFKPPPNIVTANGDGYNDFFALPETLPGKCEEGVFQKVFIYDRWGRLTYSAEDIQFEWYPELEPAGTYFYLIEFETFSYTGYITVIK